MTDYQLLQEYWSAFGHLDFDDGEVLDKEDILGSELFTENEADRLVTILSGSADSSVYPQTIHH